MDENPRIVDAQTKAEHAVRMMHAAAQVADLAPADRQQRLLARYVHLNAEPAQFWMGRWSASLQGSVDMRAVEQGAKTPLKRFRQCWAGQKAIRDKLAAKRQAVERRRSADLRATLALWSSITPAGIHELCDRARSACAALGDGDVTATLDETTRATLREALAEAALDPDSVYTDSTSYALGERNLVHVADSAARGQRVTQINDVYAHLELLYAVRSFARRTDDLGLMLRAAVIVEVCALVELVVGPPPGAQRSRREGLPLRELVIHDCEQDGQDYLALLRGDHFDQYRVWLRFARDKVAVHLDRHIRFTDLRDVLLEADPDHLLQFVDAVLDVLDLAACSNVRLHLLVLGNRQLHGMVPAPARSVPAALESGENVALLDHDLIAWSAGGFDQPTNIRMAGVMVGRPWNRRSRWYPDPTASV